MAKLQMLSFEDDDIIAQRIKEESNYCDVAHLYVATYGICKVILQELSKVEIISTATGEVVASKWDEDLPRCADSRKSAINKTGWDGDTFRLYLGRPVPFDKYPCNFHR